MPVDWKSPDSYNRLLAAVCASLPDNVKFNYKRIADMYGEGATYDAIEGRFRIIKKQAQKLKEEVENGRPIAPPRGANRSADTTPRKPKTPRKQDSQDGVLTGRVSKSNQNSPTKRRPNSQVKREMMENASASASTSASESSYSATDVETPSSTYGMQDSMITDNSFCCYDQSFNHIIGTPHMAQPHEMMGFSYDTFDFDHGV